MLYIKAFINEKQIDEIHIWNSSAINEKGEYRYIAWFGEGIENKNSRHRVVVYHKREDGWMKLTEKVIKAIKKVEKAKGKK